MSDKMFTVPGIKASRISAPVNTSSIGQTASWGNIGRGIAQAGANIGAGIQARKTNLGLAEDQIAKGKQPVDKLQSRIDKAKAQGKDAKAAKLQGRKERRDMRDANKASRITAKNIDKKKKLTKKEFFKGQKFNEKQKEKGGAISTSHFFKPMALPQPNGVAEPGFSLPTISDLEKHNQMRQQEIQASPFSMKTFDKFSKIAKDL